MSKSKSIRLLIAVVTFGVLTFTATSYAQNYCYWDNWQQGAGMGWWNNNVPAKYALSADQITKINDLRTRYSEKIVPLQNELRALRMQIRGYASRFDADVNKIKDYRKQARKLEAKIDDYRLDLRKDINKVLTKEQRLYFTNGGYGWWDADNGWWHQRGRYSTGMSGRMMNYDRCRW